MDFLLGNNLDAGTMLFRFCLAAILGALIGMERDIRGRNAGIRTHLLVSAGAALFTLISMRVNLLIDGQHGDIGRIAAQVVSGIGFLGAGTIIHEGLSIRGLTSAACLWLAAAIGMTAAVGFHVIAIVATALIVLILIALKSVEKCFVRSQYLKIKLAIATEEDLDKVHHCLEKIPNMKMHDASIVSNQENNHIEIEARVEVFSKKSEIKIATEIVDALAPVHNRILSYSIHT